MRGEERPTPATSAACNKGEGRPTLLATHLRGAAKCCELIAALRFRREGLVDASAKALARAAAAEEAEEAEEAAAQKAAEDAEKTEAKEEAISHAT
jgi:hypothetical protein